MDWWIHDIRSGKGVFGLKNLLLGGIGAEDVLRLRDEPLSRGGWEDDGLALDRGENAGAIMFGILLIAAVSE
jgi:hypothetical protein